jgi:hypothetical protein
MELNFSFNADSISGSLITNESKIQFTNVNAYSTSHLYNIIDDSSQVYNSIPSLCSSLLQAINSLSVSSHGTLYQNAICSSIYHNILSKLTFPSEA